MMNGPPAQCGIWCHFVINGLHTMRRCGAPIGHDGDHAPLLDSPDRSDAKAILLLREALDHSPADEVARGLAALLRARGYQLKDGAHPEGADAFDEAATTIMEAARRLHPYT